MRRRGRWSGHPPFGRAPFGRVPTGMPPADMAPQGFIPGPTAVRNIAEVDRDKCIGCGRCMQVCPTGAIRLDAEGKAVVSPDLCRGCAACMGVCPVGAIQMVVGSSSSGAQSHH